MMTGGAEASSLASNHRPATQPNAHRLQIVVADGANVRLRKIFHLVDRSALRDEGADRIDQTKQRTGAIDQCRRDSRAGIERVPARRPAFWT